MEITTTWPSAPPANFVNRETITLSRTRSSAPPITITGPAAPATGKGRTVRSAMSGSVSAAIGRTLQVRAVNENAL